MGHLLSTKAPVTVAEVVTDPARLRALADEWNDLWDRAPAVGLFQSFDYCLDAWESVARPAGHRLACVTGRRDGRLVAVWPFVLVRRRLRTCARPLVASGVELHELLLDESVDPDEWVQQAWDALLRSARIDLVDVSFFENSASASALRRLPSSEVEASEAVCVAVDLRGEPDWDAYYGSLSKSYRKDFAKSRRRLEALGAIEFEVLPAGDDRMAALVEWTLAQKRRWAEQTGKNGEWLYSDRYRAFLERQLSRPGNGVAMTLTVDGDLLATQLGAISKNRFEAVIAGFNADHEKHSPGARLTEAMIRWAWERGLDCELGAGAEPYKLFWSRNRRTTITVHRMAVSRRGRLALALSRSTQRVKRLLPGAASR